MKNAISRFSILMMVVVLLTGGNAFAGWISEAGDLNLPTGEFDAVVFDGVIAYCATGYGLTVFDFAAPTVPDAIHVLGTPGYAKSVALDMSGDYVYIADGWNGLVVVDVTGDPEIVATLDLGGDASFVEYCNDNVVVCMGGDGIALVNCMNPMAPT
jgi:hypothetical protein